MAEDGVERPEDAAEQGSSASSRTDVSREMSDGDRLRDAEEEVLDFLEGLLEAMGIHGSVELTTSLPSSILASIQGEEAGLLIGRKGKTLDAVQELLRAAVQRQVGFGLKVSLDVEGYRDRRRLAIVAQTLEVIEQAKETGEAELEPMSAYERKIVHDLVAEQAGVTSFSEGEGSERRVIIRSTEQKTDQAQA